MRWRIRQFIREFMNAFPLSAGCLRRTPGIKPTGWKSPAIRGGIARVWRDESGNWSIGNSGYGQVTVRVTANDGGRAAAEHTFSFVSPVQSVSVALETHPDGILRTGETDRALVSIIPSDRTGYQLSVSDATVLRLDAGKGLSPD